MSILTNARDSIVMGLEDYSSSDPRRLISCTRNLFSGILLLFKHKLSLLSPASSEESLIKQRVLPKFDASGNVVWVGQGKKTVDVQQIKERFNSLGINVHWRRVSEINKFRNDIEHYHSTLSKDAMHDLISNSFIVIRDFISEHLSEDPKSLLGDSAWSTLVSVSEVYEKEKDECVQVIDSIEWGSEALHAALVSYKCTNCGSGLITMKDPQPEQRYNRFSCKSCDAAWEFEVIAEAAIEEYFAGQNYASVAEGGELATIPCPMCNKHTYIVEEQHCVLCKEGVEHECQRCGMDIPPEEIDGSGYCSWCAYMMSKDD